MSLILSSEERWFQTVGADEQKLRWPNRMVCEHGTTMWPRSADCSRDNNTL